MADLTTLENVKASLFGRDPSAIDAEESLRLYIAAASTWFRRQVGRQLELGAYTEKQIHEGGDFIATREYPVVSVATFTADGVSVPAAPTDADPGWHIIGGRLHVRGWYVPEGSVVSLTYSAGYSPIPADIEQAVREMVALKYREKGSVGAQTVSALGQSITFLPSITPRSVQDVIDGYRRVSV